MDSVMMEASTSAPAPVPSPAVIFLDFLNSPTEPVHQTVFRCPSVDGDDGQRQAQGTTTMETAMDQLKNDFENILHLQVKGAVTTVVTEPSSTTESTSMEENFTAYRALSQKECENLKSIAMKMSSKGRLDKLVNVYVSERKSFLDVHFQKLWDEKLSCNDIQRLEGKVVEKKIDQWTKAADYIIRKIFAYEKELANQVFKGLGNAAEDSSFLATVKDSMALLLDFAEAVSSCRKSPERLQKLVIMYKAFSDLMPDIKSVFESGVAESIRERAQGIVSRFAQVVVLTLGSFEDAIIRDLSNEPILGGTIHNLTKYVMGCTTTLFLENREALTSLIVSRPSNSLEVLEGLEPLAAHLLWIIMILLQNLSCKSKNYQDPLLARLFMMNNVHYIAQHIGQSAGLREMIRDNYLNELMENVEESMTGYLSGTWDRLLYCLRNEGLHVSWGFTSGVSRSVLKERFKSFNNLFQEICQTQVMWAVPDPHLRMKLHQAILNMLIPPYRDFLGQFGSHLGRVKCPERYMAFSPDDLESMISGLFGYIEFL